MSSLDKVFQIDLTKPLIGTYKEYIWAGIIKNKRWFEYGDSGGKLNSAVNWAYLLSKYQEPQLSWFYNFLNQSSTTKVNYEDVVFNTTGIPQEDPFHESPVKLFQDVGTTVFKSGWEIDDFVFVMRTGPAYNHQHLDQGSFWLADRGKIFIEERPLSSSHYYDDPIYESWLTQPVGHSTILVNGNHQSQRVGDHLNFAAGFDDYAYVSHFLDGKEAAFTSGNIGKLYWGQVADLTRNVLYLKPGTVLMLDVAIPAKEDAEVTLLYQTKRLDDIQAGKKKSTIVKDNATLHIMHLAPASAMAKAVATPHYLRTLQNVQPLEQEGMLTVSSHTNGSPLVLANLLTTTYADEAPEVTTEIRNRVVSGTTKEKKFAFTTRPGQLYQIEDISTDALAITWDDVQIFAAKATIYHHPNIQLTSEMPISFQFSHLDMVLKYYIEEEGSLTFTLKEKPSAVYINNKPTQQFTYEGDVKTLKMMVPGGEGILSFR